MKTIITILLSALFLSVKGQEFPGKYWENASPSESGFSSEKLSELENFIRENLETSTMLVVHHGKTIFMYGDPAEKIEVRSARKSFMSALYGIFVENGMIDPGWTMGEMKITDFEPLTETEKTATIEQCLMARSGIYLPAEAESQAMLSVKPGRGEYEPGEYWCYNNWDFNVLATILQSMTGKGFFTLFKTEIADKTGMSDFNILDGTYYQYTKSIHPAYHFRISANSMARFGYIMLRNGKWDDRQVLPAAWIKTITSPVSDATNWGSDSYGYMWWVSRSGNKYQHFMGCDVPDGTYSARGAYGQFLVVIPAYDMVVVHLVESDDGQSQVSAHAMGYILNKLFEAGGFSYSGEYVLTDDDIERITGRSGMQDELGR